MALPWWVLPAVALLLLSLLAMRLRRRWPAPVVQIAARAARLERFLDQLGERCRGRAQQSLQRYFAFRVNRRLYYKLSDYEQGLEVYHREVGVLCAEIRDTLADLRRELRYSDSELPAAPGWLEDFERALAELGSADTAEVAGAVKKVKKLQVIATRQQAEAMREYRWAAAIRQRILARSGPNWKRMRRSIQDIQRLLKRLAKGREDLTDVSARYAGLQAAAAGADRGHRLLLVFTGWFLLFGLAAMAAIFNAGLMQEVLHDGLAESDMRQMAIPALIISHTAGLLLFGSLLACAMRWSLLLPTISALPQERRRQLILGSMAMLILLAFVGLSAVVDQLTTDLVVEGWVALPTLIFVGALYLLPLLAAFLVPIAARFATIVPPAILLLLYYPVSILRRTSGFISRMLSDRWPPAAGKPGGSR